MEATCSILPRLEVGDPHVRPPQGAGQCRVSNETMTKSTYIGWLVQQFRHIDCERTFFTNWTVTYFFLPPSQTVGQKSQRIFRDYVKSAFSLRELKQTQIALCTRSSLCFFSKIIFRLADPQRSNFLVLPQTLFRVALRNCSSVPLALSQRRNSSSKIENCRRGKRFIRCGI